MQTLDIEVTNIFTQFVEAPATGAQPFDNDAARSFLAALFRQPLQSCAIVDSCGRAVLLEYELIGADDPDIAILTGRRASVVNRHVLELQTARARCHDPARWYDVMNAIIAKITRALLIAEASDAESAFILGWARGVRDAFRVIYGGTFVRL